MIRVQRADFDPGAEIAALTDGNPRIGGVCSFIGLVRDLHPEVDPEAARPGLSAMTLEHYPGMTERMLERIEADAWARWPLEGSCIIHRHGRMTPGERIVLVATASPHRQAAFDACQFLIDWLKTQAPFWKYEETPDGGHWVEARDDDNTAAARWTRG